LTPRHSFLTRFVLVGAAGALSLPALSDPPESAILPSTNVLSPTQAKKASLIREIGRLPLAFESNQGQSDARVRFLSHTADSTLFLTPSEAVFTLSAPSARFSSQCVQCKDRKAGQTAEKLSLVALRMQMVGANPKATALTRQPLTGRTNYFIGKDSRKWHAGVPTFGRVGFHNVYRGVDLVYYGNQKHLEYDFIVAPHADPKQIQLHFAGAKSVQINATGELTVRTAGRELTWQKPVVYQQDANGKHSVKAHFRLKTLPNGQTGVRFALGRYDTARPLVIDPVLLYSTYLGGSNQVFGNQGVRIAVDSGGNAYVVGVTSSTDFPTTGGAFQTVNKATGQFPTTTFVTKLNPTGTALVYSTYLGGTGPNGDNATGLAIDSSGNAYVVGFTNSTDFPITAGAFQTVNKSTSQFAYTGFVTKLNSTGTALIYSTYLGGTNEDDPSGIAVDSNGSAYVTGNAKSTDFPTTPGAFQTVNNGQGTTASNAFITKFNSTGTALVYSTYLGGSGVVGGKGDGGSGIAVNSSGNAYVTGTTYSADFPVTPGAFQPTNHKQAANFSNAFVTKLNSTGTALVYSTYLGGSGQAGGNQGAGDGATGIALDSADSAFVVGRTYSADFPITTGVVQPVKDGGTDSTSIFVTKFNATGTALIYSTYLGRSSDNSTGIAIDGNGNAYVVGYTYVTNYPTTIGAFQRRNNKQNTAFQANTFVTKLNAAGTALVYSTYLGGGNNGGNADYGNGIAVDGNGRIYVTGSTNSADFPITPGAFQPEKNGNVNSLTAFVTKLSAAFLFPDFNNDGFTDLLLQNASTGAIASWYMQGAQQVGSASFSLTPPTEYGLIGSGDFFGNGSTTLVLQNSVSNQIAFWYTSGANNATIPGGNFVNPTPGAGWKVVGVGDFNADGKSDLVFQNQTTHQIAVWFMNGYVYNGGVLLPFTPLEGWNVVGTGDFNADGFTDLVFQNQTTGQIALWYMHGTTYTGGAVMTAVPAAGYVVAGVGDYNGDGVADLLFQNAATNQAVVWYLQNGTYVGGAALSLSPPAGWHIAGPR